MLTSEDVSLFWDRLTSWIFGQKTETVLLIALLVFLAAAYWRALDDNTELRKEIISLSRERIKGN